MFNDEWLKNLKVGDKVVVHYGTGGSMRAITTVEKITPKRVISVKGWSATFNEHGFERGKHDRANAFSRASLAEATPETMNEIRLKVRRRWLRNLDWDKVPDEVVKQACDLIKPHIKEEGKS